MGQVARKEGPSVDFGERRGPVVGDPQRQPVCHAVHGGVGSQQERRQRVDLDADQLGIGKSLAGDQKEAPRACARAPASVAQRIKAPDEGKGKRPGYRSRLVEVTVQAGGGVPVEVWIVCDERS